MEQITLAAKKRERVGKTVKKLRSNGIIPGVLYGHNVETTHVELNDRDFKKAFKQGGENTIISLVIDGKTQPVLIHEVQHHYLRGEPIHVDFFAVNMTEKLNATIPLNFVGESMAVKATGGVLVKNLSELQVECLPGDLPQSFDIDISVLNTFEDVIRVSDIKLSDKVVIQNSPEDVIVSVTPPRSEEEMSSLNEAVTEDVTKVEGVVKPETDVKAEGEAKEEKAA